MLLVAVSAASTVQQAAQEPGLPIEVVTPEQYEGIVWMREELPADAVVLTNIIAGPLVYADSGRTTYAPLLFGDPNSASDWRVFHDNPDAAEFRHAFLSAYGQPLYIAIFPGHFGELPNGMRPAHFEGPEFATVLDSPDTVVIRFDASA